MWHEKFHKDENQTAAGNPGFIFLEISFLNQCYKPLKIEIK